jgi:hypothetical protein
MLQIKNYPIFATELQKEDVFMIPNTFNDWKKCIEQDCKIKLTNDFAKQRLSVYENEENEETKKFVQLYGEQHLKNIITWLQQI